MSAPQGPAQASRNRRRPRRPQQQPPYAPQPARIAPLSTSAPLATTESSDKSAYLSNAKFSDFFSRGLLTKALFERIPFEYCTEVQEKTLLPILEGRDVFGQAKTGTGKTIAFLVPAIERLARRPVPPPEVISILVIAPTRELCLQIEKEAKMLFEGSVYRAQSAIGGVNIKTQRQNLLRQRSDVLIATPGRLVDHIENSNLGPRLKSVQTFIMDEADRLLDEGFQKSLIQIANQVTPKNDRQTLLFSATVDKKIREIAHVVLKDKHEFITTISENDEATHEHVTQDYIVAPLAKIDTVLLTLLRRAAQEPFPKIIIFYCTARGAALAYDLFKAIPDLQHIPMFEIHSRLSQSARIKQADGFKTSLKGILFSSDVTARGMDFPSITAVYQIGIPSSPEQYIHRLGRTARAGAAGYGVLILADFEERAFLTRKEVRELPLKPHPEAQQLTDETNPEFMHSKETVVRTYDAMDPVAKSQAYQAFMGYYNGFQKQFGWTKEDLVQTANSLALDVMRYRNTDGTNNPPPLLAKTVGMMGLRGVAGLNIVKPQRFDGAQASGGYTAQNGRGSAPPAKRQRAA
ncbi:DEAD-domain-containing protein [Calocera viscosa TUFC12733]|uniref:ATP-dependent RNA helicase n=1 Tax=Calocera viscosa (strain TUFC12733) TaxID=1330018 RepID=A0A167R826_CALVF|nr:DEAD-domain-containing protein [Calocera viscosa TUFC12733]